MCMAQDVHHRLKISYACKVALVEADQAFHVRLGDLVLGSEPVTELVRELRERVFEVLEICLQKGGSAAKSNCLGSCAHRLNRQGGQIGIRHVPIILCILLGPQRVRLSRGFVESSSLLRQYCDRMRGVEGEVSMSFRLCRCRVSHTKAAID